MKRIVFLTAASVVVGSVAFLLVRGDPGGMRVHAQEPQPPAAPAAPDPAFAAALWEQGTVSEAAGQYELAAQQFKASAEANLGSLGAVQAMLRAGRCIEDAGQHLLAVPLYDQGILLADDVAGRSDPTTAAKAQGFKDWAVNRRAVALAVGGQHAQAIQAYESIINAQPTVIHQIAGMFTAARHLSQADQWQDALHFYDMAITSADANPDAPFVADAPSLAVYRRQAFIRRAYAYMVTGALDRATSEYQAIIAADPLSVESQQLALNAGRMLKTARRYNDALTFLQQAVTIANAAGSAGSPEEVAARQGYKRTALLVMTSAYQLMGDCGMAAQAYADFIADKVPLSPAIEEDILKVGTCLEEAGLFDQAVNLYAQVLAAATRPAASATRRTALLGKARACQQAGRIEDGLKAAEAIKADYPTSTAAAEAQVLEARLKGTSPQQAEALYARQLAAADLFKQARQAWEQNQRDLAWQFFEGILADYADTPTGLRIMHRKAASLDHQKRTDEATTAYLAVLNRLGREAVGSGLAQQTRSRVMGLFADQLIAKTRNREAVSHEDWEKLRAICTDMITHNEDPDRQAAGHYVLIEAYLREGKPAEAVQASEAFFQKYDRDGDFGQFAAPITMAHYFNGVALQRLQRYPEAIAHFRRIIAVFDPGYTAALPELYNEFVPEAYYQVWLALWRSKAPANEVSKAADDVFSNYPGMPGTDRVRRMTESYAASSR